MGQGIALTISRKFNDFDKFLHYFLQSQYNENIEGIGDKTIHSLRKYLKDEENLKQINKLLAVIKIKYEIKQVIDLFRVGVRIPTNYKCP